jgi:predicted transcriptional regulator
MATQDKTVAPNDLSEELASFIEAMIPSVWALELLILIRSDPHRAWAPKSLVAALRASDRLVADILQAFGRSGLVTEEGDGVRYRPSLAVDGLCAELEAAYRERPVSVINAIVRQRSAALNTFADAFRFGGRKS